MRYVKILCLLFAAWAASSTLMATEGALSGKFTVNATGGQIVFSKGNLRATTTDLGAHWTWSFAANQWSFIGNAAANTAITGNGTVSVNGSVDLFCWSTAATYYGIHNSTTSGDYPGDFVDWGTNAITNGGNTANLWRTLTKKEWEHLLYTRANASNLRSEGTVNGVHGYILLPDNWTTPSGLSFTARTRNWTTNTYNATQWAQMEEAGAVFLPTAYWRTGVEIYYDGKDYGHYWSASPGAYTTYAGSVFIDEATPEYTLKSRESMRRQGESVRLAQEVPFDLQVCGTPITGFNCTDIASAVSGVTGTVSYNPSTNTLTLNNATITASGAYGIQNSIPNLTIEVLGTNTLVGANNWSGIRLDASTTITGGGKLSVATTGDGIGIFIYNDPTLDLTEHMTLTVTGGTTLYAKGLSGISGYGGSAAIAKTYGAVLTVDNAKVTAAFHGNDGALNSGRHGGALEYLHALNMNGVSIISPSNVTYTAQQLDNLLDASTSDNIHTVYIGTPPEDTYYRFDQTYAAGTTVAPYEGNGWDLTVGQEVIAKSPAAEYMQNTYSYGISTTVYATGSKVTKKMLTFHVAASTDNPAHILLICKDYKVTTAGADNYWGIYIASTNQWVTRQIIRPTHIDDDLYRMGCYEFVVNETNDYDLSAVGVKSSGKAEVYELRVIYEKNALYQSIRNSLAIEFDNSTTTADRATTSFFRLCQTRPFDEVNGVQTLGGGVYFRPYANGTIVVDLINNNDQTAGIALDSILVFTNVSSGIQNLHASTVDANTTVNDFTIPRKVYKGGEYRLGYNTGSYIKSVRFIPDHYTVTLDPNGGTVDPTELYYVPGISEPITPPLPTPTREGWDFDNWYREGEDIIFPFTPTADVTFTADWDMTITLMSDGVIVHQESGIPDDETRMPDSQSCTAGCRTFDYWTADQDVQIGGELKASGYHIPDNTPVLMLRNTIFTAHWINPAPYVRSGLSAGKIGTLCVPGQVPSTGISGATFFSIAGKNTEGTEINFVEETELTAGQPYVFEATGSEITLNYDPMTPLAASAGNHNGLYGTFADIHVGPDANIYYIADNQLWRADTFAPPATDLTVEANRCYIKIGEVPASSASPAPGKRYITLGVNETQGIDVINGQEGVQKLLRNGQLFIIREGKTYNVLGFEK